MRHVLIAIALLSLPACGAGSPQLRSDEPPGLLALAPSTSDTPAGQTVAPARAVPRFPEAVLRDPAERFRLMERLRIEAVSKTRAVPEAHWQGELRPALRRQLTGAGLAPGDVEFLLWEIDQARSSAGEGP